MDDYSDDLLDTETLYLETAAGLPSLFEGSTESQQYSLAAFMLDNPSELQSSQGFQVDFCSIVLCNSFQTNFFKVTCILDQFCCVHYNKGKSRNKKIELLVLYH